MTYVLQMIDFMRRMRGDKRLSEDRGIPAALFITLALHAVLLFASAFIHLREERNPDPTVQISFSRQTSPARESREEAARGERAMSGRSRGIISQTKAGAAAVPGKTPPRPEPEKDRGAIQTALPLVVDDRRDRDSSLQAKNMALRSVLDRGVTPEQAWEMLAGLIEQYPQFREMALREMVAGQGLPPDSLPKINLHLDQILKNGIQPSWDTQRQAIEEASRSFDPVHGWTNKGSYGPQVNVIGIILFLIDLIEGE